jgi:tetratricopeptide (TPR) repeat protein
MAGRALAVYRLAAPDQAYALFDAVMRQVQSADVFALGGFFALMVGKPEQATALFRQGLALAPNNIGCQTMLTQMALVANRKEEARNHADNALLGSPDSPLTLMNAGLVDIAYFDLKRAEERMQKAASHDPGFLDPLLYLARLQLGVERLDDAAMTLDKARAIAPQSAAVQSMDGFTQLALRKFTAAENSFQRAVQADPALGDPHLGLGLCAYARGDEVNGLREILTATLLDPKVSQFHSMLGKAFYQSRAFDKALDAFDYASRLDSKDPTPHLYKGIALTDLNRPAEAIREINTSISKNNNRAVFRSSLMLDRDLAVRNADLAKPYSALGLGEWSFSKALTAVKADPLNPSAHLFLSSVFASTRQRTSASGSELLMYRLLSPANQNTFTGVDYTPMFESPYMRMAATGSVGTWSNDNRIAAGGAEVYGGFPGFAADVFGSVTRDEGMRDRNSLSQPTMLSGLVKWEPSTKDAFFGSATLYDTLAEDNRNLSDATYKNALNLDQNLRTRFGELGYVRRFSPEAALIVYAKQGFNAWDYEDEAFDPDWLTGVGWSLSETRQLERQTSMPYTNLQAQQQFIWSDHTFMVGVDSFRGKFHYDFHELDSYWLSWPGWYEGIWDEFTFKNSYALTQDSLSLYLLDYWKPSENVVIEAGLSADRSSSLRFGYSDPVDRHFTGSRLGVNWQMTSQDVLRLAFQNYLNTHMTYQNTLQPADVAGFPSWINADDGTEVLEAGLAWERQWNELTYSVFRFNAHEIKNPQYDATSPDNEIKDVLVRRYQAQATLNRILSPAWGGWTTVSAKRLLPNDFALFFSPNTDFTEADLALGLSYLHENGFGAHAEGFLIHQHFCDEDARASGGDTLENETFAICNVGCSYTFPDKRGRVGLEVKNIFDQQFAYQLEMVALDSIYPARQAVLSVSLYF